MGKEIDYYDRDDARVAEPPPSVIWLVLSIAAITYIDERMWGMVAEPTTHDHDIKYAGTNARCASCTTELWGMLTFCGACRGWMHIACSRQCVWCGIWYCYHHQDPEQHGCRGQNADPELVRIVHGDDLATVCHDYALDHLDEAPQGSIMINRSGRVGPGGARPGLYLNRCI